MMYQWLSKQQTYTIYLLLTIEPAQLPYTAGDYWLGIEYPSSYTPAGDSVSLLLINPEQLQTAGVQSGFVIDEWIEMIPGKQQTTGITFNYNNPNASPPQSLLLAVTPANNQSMDMG